MRTHRNAGSRSRPSTVGSFIASGLLIAALLTPDALATSTATAGAAESAATPATRGDAGAVAGIRWRDCGARFDCARYRVPLDYDRPSGRQVSLALVKLPAAVPERRIGALFVNPGGPGEFGVDFVKYEARASLPKRVLNRFDVVGFDPRGVGKSSPLHCFDSGRQQNRFWNRLPLFPVTRPEARTVIAANDHYAALCRGSDPVLAAHMSTGEVARDLNRLRRAVGDRRLTFVGYSYGTMIATTYANMFPGRVRAIVADGVIDPVKWIGRGDRARHVPVDVRLKSDLGSDAALRRFLRDCQRSPARCAFASADTRAKFDRLMRILEHHPIRAGRPLGTVTYDVAVSDVLHGLYGFGSWRGFAHDLQQLWEHRTDRPAKHDAWPSITDRHRPNRSPQYANYLDASYAVTCGDSTNPASPRAWIRWAARRAKVSPYFGRYWTWLDGPCASWPSAPDRYRGPFDRRTSRPLLFVGNLRDPATRYHDAVAAAGRMPGARLLTIDGTGHTSLTQPSECAERVLVDYLVDGALPARGLVCEVEHSLFDPELVPDRPAGP